MSTPVALIVALGALVWLFRRGFRSSVLAYVALFFTFFAFGPVISVVLGDEIYSGTVTNLIPQAATGFAVALIVWAVVDAFYPERVSVEAALQRIRHGARKYSFLRPLYWAAAVYGLAVAILIGSSGRLGKLEAVAEAGPWHYRYLLLQILVMSSAFIAWRDRGNRLPLKVNFFCYVMYCAVTSERDFIFVAFSLLLHATAYGIIRRGRWIPLASAAFAILGSLLFAIRQSAELTLNQILNQGSILFVDTYVLSIKDHLPAAQAHSWAQLLNFTGTPRVSLSDWFVTIYAPGSDSGYGFSLTAEAQMNFGLLGVAILFAGIGITHRWILIKGTKYDLALYMSPLLVVQLMYGFRGDLRTLLISLVYGLVFFGLIAIFSRDDEPDLPARAGSQRTLGRLAR